MSIGKILVLIAAVLFFIAGVNIDVDKLELVDIGFGFVALGAIFWGLSLGGTKT